MMIALHKNAPTTLAIRAEMVTTLETAVALALCDSVSQSINEKRKSLARFNVASHIPQRLQTTFTPTQKQIVVVLRKILLLRFDDLLAVSRKFLSLQDTSSVWIGFLAATTLATQTHPNPKDLLRLTNPSKATSRRSSPSMSNTGPRCLTQPAGAICLCPPTVPRVWCLFSPSATMVVAARSFLIDLH